MAIFTILYGNYDPPHGEFKVICIGKFARRTWVNFTHQYGKNRQRCQQDPFYCAVWQLLLYFYREFPSKIRSVWDQKGAVYHELLKPGETVTGDRYRQQLIKFNQALKRKRPEWRDRTHKVILLHDNARLYVAKPVKTYLENMKWDMLPHAPYSPDLASSDYYLFRSMQYGHSEQHFNSYEEVKNWFNEWLASKDELWY